MLLRLAGGMDYTEPLIKPSFERKRRRDSKWMEDKGDKKKGGEKREERIWIKARETWKGWEDNERDTKGKTDKYGEMLRKDVQYQT